MNSKSHTLLIVLLAVTSLVACSDQQDRKETHRSVTQVVREVLQGVMPEQATGQTLELTRVIIPAGMEIEGHTHPGPQLAVIAEGTLTYTVIRGEVEVRRSASTGTAVIEKFVAGQSAELTPGDSIIELPALAHRARNGGKVPVVIYLSSLFPQGASPSSPSQ